VLEVLLATIGVDGSSRYANKRVDTLLSAKKKFNTACSII